MHSCEGVSLDAASRYDTSEYSPARRPAGNHDGVRGTSRARPPSRPFASGSPERRALDVDASAARARTDPSGRGSLRPSRPSPRAMSSARPRENTSSAPCRGWALPRTRPPQNWRARARGFERGRDEAGQARATHLAARNEYKVKVEVRHVAPRTRPGAGGRPPARFLFPLRRRPPRGCRSPIADPVPTPLPRANARAQNPHPVKMDKHGNYVRPEGGARERLAGRPIASNAPSGRPEKSLSRKNARTTVAKKSRPHERTPRRLPLLPLPLFLPRVRVSPRRPADEVPRLPPRAPRPAARRPSPPRAQKRRRRRPRSSRLAHATSDRRRRLPRREKRLSRASAATPPPSPSTTTRRTPRLLG